MLASYTLIRLIEEKIGKTPTSSEESDHHREPSREGKTSAHLVQLFVWLKNVTSVWPGKSASSFSLTKLSCKREQSYRLITRLSLSFSGQKLDLISVPWEDEKVFSVSAVIVSSFHLAFMSSLMMMTREEESLFHIWFKKISPSFDVWRRCWFPLSVTRHSFQTEVYLFISNFPFSLDILITYAHLSFIL